MRNSSKKTFQKEKNLQHGLYMCVIYAADSHLNQAAWCNALLKSLLLRGAFLELIKNLQDSRYSVCWLNAKHWRLISRLARWTLESARIRYILYTPLAEFLAMTWTVTQTVTQIVNLPEHTAFRTQLVQQRETLDRIFGIFKKFVWTNDPRSVRVFMFEFVKSYCLQ